jgi:hypothetical protein
MTGPNDTWFAADPDADDSEEVYVTGLYGSEPDELPVISGTVTSEEYKHDPELYDGQGSMAAFLAQEQD